MDISKLELSILKIDLDDYRSNNQELLPSIQEIENASFDQITKITSWLEAFMLNSRSTETRQILNDCVLRGVIMSEIELDIEAKPPSKEELKKVIEMLPVGNPPIPKDISEVTYNIGTDTLNACLRKGLFSGLKDTTLAGFRNVFVMALKAGYKIGSGR